MKRIVIINQDSGYLMIDIANTLVRKGLQTHLITGRLIPRDRPISESVKVRRISKYQRRSWFHRLLSWNYGFLQMLTIIKLWYRKDYLFIISNPPISTFLPVFCRNRFSLMIFDVYPDALTKMGFFSDNSFIVKYWRKINRKVYSRADNIFTLTENMSILIRQYSGDKEIEVVPIWSSNEFFKSISKDSNPFINEHNLHNKFIVLYSGNLGASHNVEIIPEIASRITNPKVIFLIIGDGHQKRWLIKQIQILNLNNCRLLPLQPVDSMPNSFASADLAIVSLSITASGLSLPSKTFNYMSAGLPLLCIAGTDSELNNIVTKYNNGRCFPPDKINEIVSFIEEIAQRTDLSHLFKANSIKASHDFTPHNAEIISTTLIESM